MNNQINGYLFGFAKATEPFLTNASESTSPGVDASLFEDSTDTWSHAVGSFLELPPSSPLRDAPPNHPDPAASPVEAALSQSNRSTTDWSDTGSSVGPQWSSLTPTGEVERLASSQTQTQRVNKRKASTSALRPNALVGDERPMKVIKKDSKGKVQGIIMKFGGSKNVRAPLEHGLREATALTRRLGVCERCRRKKARCDMPENPYQPCGACAKLPLRLRMPLCIRVEILDIYLHRLGSTLNDHLQTWTSRKEGLQLQGNPSTAVIPASRKILLTQETGFLLEVKVARFIPEPGDAVSYGWVDGGGHQRELKMPPYYICDMPHALQSMQDYALVSSDSYIADLLDGTNPIIWKTFETASSYVATTKSPLVSLALQFWAATRLTERTWRICNPDTLGVVPPLELDNPWRGIVPVTPVMDTQLDELAIKGLLIPMKRRLLVGLKRAIDEKKRENWFEIFLAIFVIMCNVEWILSDVIDYTKRHGIEAKNVGKPSLVRAYMHACKTLLSYYHNACQGAAPISLQWGAQSTDNDVLTSEQVQYVQSLQAEIAKQRSKLEALKEIPMYETPMYWCVQMLFPDWRGDQPHAGEIYDFTEEDFLTS